MRRNRFFTVAQFREAARRRLPRLAFDFVYGGSGNESAVRRNRQTLDDIRLLPRALVAVAGTSLRTSIFGREYAAPFGIAPMGLCNLVAPGTDLALARAAADANVPHCLSTAATTRLEEVARAAEGRLWFQLYVSGDRDATRDLVRRAADAGVEVLVVTVDIQAPGKRARDLANGLSLPLRLDAGMIADVVRHPRWLLALLRHGAPHFATLAPYADTKTGGGAGAHAEVVRRLLASDLLDWQGIAELRDQWRGRLVLKGILNPADAVRAREAGVDGIIVSNHGGRQLASAPSPVEMLPRIREAVGPSYPLLVDSGFRDGDDIVRGLALGADMVLLGSAFLYAVGALGIREGAARALAILAEETETALKLLGCRSVADLRGLEPRIWPAQPSSL